MTSSGAVIQTGSASRAATALVWALTAGYAVAYFILDKVRFDNYRAGVDTGSYTQNIASAFGCFCNTIEGANHFATHFSPVYYALAPLVLVARSNLVLIAVTSLAAALVGPALYLIARKRLPPWPAAAVTSVALVYPPLAAIAFSDFHQNQLAPAATCWLLWAFDQRRGALAAVFAALCLMIKEDQAIILTFLGIAGTIYFWRHGEKRWAYFCAGVALCSVAILIGWITLLRPIGGPNRPFAGMHFYNYHYALARPSETAPFINPMKGWYLLHVFGPLLGVAFLSRVVLLATPGLVGVLASHETVVYNLGSHYGAVWLGFVLVAFVIGAARVWRWSPVIANFVTGVSIALCLWILVYASPTGWSYYLTPLTPKPAAIDAMLARIPMNASVGTVDEIFAHMGFYPQAVLGIASRPEYALFLKHYHSVWWVETGQPQFAAALRSGEYRKVGEMDDVVLYRRQK